jgi:hypothetical protein
VRNTPNKEARSDITNITSTLDGTHATRENNPSPPVTLRHPPQRMAPMPREGLETQHTHHGHKGEGGGT